MEHPSGASASVSATLQGSTIFLRTASPTSLRPTTQRTATRRSNRPLTLPIQTASDGAAVSGSEGSSDGDASFQENESDDELLIPRYGPSTTRSRSHSRRQAAAKEKKAAKSSAGAGGSGGARPLARSVSQGKRFFFEDESSCSSKTTRLGSSDRGLSREEESSGRVPTRGPAGSSSDGSPHDPNHSHTCNCRKSRCLKLYCECFASDVFCNGCNCVNCKNNPEHLKEREEVKQALIQRDPHVFEPHVVWDTPATRTNLRGCRCQKTRCVKKYCDCFQNGICCGPNCRCVDCKNTEEAALNRALSA
ncbi:uncharacterized protein [Blastocystis hominis]|uniref:CRC domain-containing protein n=1 Tax=Blastocystis hominis TaxID=12968 RepID=D8M0Y8_BLAHO|nr:uncharacterized protein [Blastocystis hominis]CBK21727.2 unnamed protein product [Blastocystis hominis]|eukprot:XP_012895775.1 uncharacterized protein [Blastocystis hominis]